MQPAPESLLIEGAPSFRLAAYIAMANGFPYVDWKAVESWVAPLAVDRRPAAWSACAKAWLLRLGSALGPQFKLAEGQRALVLSALEPRLARVTVEFVDRTASRILRLLDGVAAAPEKGESVLIVFDDDKSYYDYVAHYYPERGQFASSAGMFIDSGYAHFVTMRSDLRSVEPIIAHEMAHASVARLPLPLWLNEGIAVNAERALTWAHYDRYTPQEMHRKHKAFWHAREIQQFWSGESFDRADDGNMLSYDLARIMVEQMAKDWSAFRAFVLAAERNDSGEAAAREHLGVDLGEYVCALLARKRADGWAPDPAAWGSGGDSAAA